VSFAPSLTRQLYALGAGPRLAANTVYCEDPEGMEKPHIGTVADVNVEEVVSLEPDCILTSKLTSKKQVEKLMRMGLQVEVFDRPATFEEICAQLQRLAVLVGAQDTAHVLIRRARAVVDSVVALTDTMTRPRVFVQVGMNPLFTVTRESFIHDYIVKAGGRNIAADAASGMYSVEKTVAQDPDVILISTMGMKGTAQKRMWEHYTSMAAVRSGRVHVVDDDRLCSPTPGQFADMLRYITTLLHPEK
jgi:iron complex transport system substrate-binding protein